LTEPKGIKKSKVKPVGIDRVGDGIDSNVGRPDIAVRRAAQRLDPLQVRGFSEPVPVYRMTVR